MRRFIKSQNASCFASNVWNTKRQADLEDGRTSRITRLYLQIRLGLDALIAGLSGAFTRQPMPVGVSSEPVTVSGEPGVMPHCRGMRHRLPNFASLAR
jgi:hypothetical protein